MDVIVKFDYNELIALRDVYRNKGNLYREYLKYKNNEANWLPEYVVFDYIQSIELVELNRGVVPYVPMKLEYIIEGFDLNEKINSDIYNNSD